MTYNCIFSNGLEAAIITDKRTVDEYGGKSDGIIKYRILSFSDNYSGSIKNGLIIWGGYAANAIITVDKANEMKLQEASLTIEDYVDNLKKVAIGVVNEGEARYIAKEKNKLQARVLELFKNETEEAKKQFMSSQTNEIISKAEERRRSFLPSFYFVGYEQKEGKNYLCRFVIDSEEIITPTSYFSVIGSPQLLHGKTFYELDNDEESLRNKPLEDLIYGGITKLLTATGNVLVGGSPDIILFKEGKLEVLDKKYSSFINNIVSARAAKFPIMRNGTLSEYNSGDAIKDIRSVLEKDNSNLVVVAKKLKDSIPNLMGGRIPMRNWRERVIIYKENINNFISSL